MAPIPGTSCADAGAFHKEEAINAIEETSFMTEMAVRHWINGCEEGNPIAESLDPATGDRVGRLADGGEASTRAARQASATRAA